MSKQIHLLQARDPTCKNCDLFAGCRSVCLMGVGNANADLFIVGEAPGREEDQVGRPFVGRAGKLLNNILATFGLSPKDVYISNAVKCRPVDNKTPVSHQISACRSYIVEEIAIVKPKLVLCLGTVAMRSLLRLKEYKLGENRGCVFYMPESDTLPVMATYHPAGILRNNDWLVPAVQDFEKALEYIKGGVPEKIQSKYFRGVAGKDYYEAVCVDLETTGLDMFDVSEEILCIGTSTDPNRGYCTPDLEKAIPLLENPNTLKVGHNIKFDWKWLLVKDIKMRGPWFDTMIAAHMLNENLPSYGLKELAATNTDMGRYADKMERAVKLVKGDYRKVPANIRETYCAMDVDATYRLFVLYSQQLQEEGLDPLFRLTMQGAKVMAAAEFEGVRIDEERRQYLQKAYRTKLTRLVEKIRSVSGESELNPHSSSQLGSLLTGKMGFPIVRYTEKGKVAVDKEVLQQLLPLDKTGIIEALLEFRSVSKLYSVYLDPDSDFVSSDGLVHATFKIHGTDTGRYSCVDPNLQQVPKKSEIKSMFTSKFPNGRIVQVDFDQGELRMLAQYCNDPLLLKTFQKGLDIHARTASAVFGVSIENVTKEQRAVGKTVNFAVLYGIGDNSLAHRLGVLPRVANKYISQYFQKHKGVREYIRSRHNEIIEKGQVSSLYGRKRRIVVADYSNRGLVASAQRQAANAPIQSALHDTNILGIVECARRFAKKGMQAHWIMEIHDAGFVDCPAEEEQEVIKIIKEVFPNPDTSEFGFKFNVPLTVQVSSGYTWKEASDRG